MVGVVSVLYGVSDALWAIEGLIIVVANSAYSAAFEVLGRAPIAIFLLAGGLGLLFDKPWSRFVYWVLPVYPMIVTLVLLPVFLGPVPSGGGLGIVVFAASLYWPIATVFLCVVAYLVSNHFRKLRQYNVPPQAGAPPLNR
jgi:hypothetical protein